MDLTPGKSGLALGLDRAWACGILRLCVVQAPGRRGGAKHSLALKMPDNFDDAYQLFVNGQQLGEFGSSRTITLLHTLQFPLPSVFPKTIRDGKVTIAIRAWMDSATPFNSADAGGLREPPGLGYASAISDELRLDWDDAGHYFGSAFLELLILTMALVIALALFGLTGMRGRISGLLLSAKCP